MNHHNRSIYGELSLQSALIPLLLFSNKFGESTKHHTHVSHQPISVQIPLQSLRKPDSQLPDARQSVFSLCVAVLQAATLLKALLGITSIQLPAK